MIPTTDRRFIGLSIRQAVVPALDRRQAREEISRAAGASSRCRVSGWVRAAIDGYLRAVTRITGRSINTVSKLLVDLGAACDDYQDSTFRNLPCRTIQADEIWSYVYARQANVPEKHRGEFGFGDVWTFTAIDADSKLIPAWMIGDRTPETAHAFMTDLAGRLATRVQMTTDGHKMYLNAVTAGIGGSIDFAQFV
jgi:hypothetical protein